MLAKNKNATTTTQTKIGTILGPGTVFNGDLTAPDMVRIDGTVNGNCNCDNNLVIGEEGIVNGDISADNIVISGKVKGNISAKGKLELYSTGKITGDLTARSLVIDENAYFEGRCTMTTTTQQPEESAQNDSSPAPRKRISESPEEDEAI